MLVEAIKIQFVGVLSILYAYLSPVGTLLNMLVFQTEAPLPNKIKQNQESENYLFKRRMHGLGLRVFDAGQIQHRNVQYPSSFSTRKIKQLEIVSLLTAPNLPENKVSMEGTSLRGLFQVPDCAWPSVCLLFVVAVGVCLFFFAFFWLLLLFSPSYSMFHHSNDHVP